jgi:hypothetical protein
MGHRLNSGIGNLPRKVRACHYIAALTGAGSEQVELDETAAAAVALLALVAGQDVEPADGSDGRDGRWRIARKVAPDRVIHRRRGAAGSRRMSLLRSR